MFFKENFNKLFDSHTHINSKAFSEDVDKVVKNAQDSGVLHIIDVAVDVESSKKSVDLAKKFSKQVFSTVGVDPEILIPGSEMKYQGELDYEAIFNELSNLIEANREYVVGIGETGVDTYWVSKSDLSSEDKDLVTKKQLKLLDVHVGLARKFKLPLTLHSRGFEKELIEYLKSKDVTGVFHSFTGNFETAKQILDRDFGLGINGIVTFKNASELRDLYKNLLSGTKINSPEDLYSRNLFLETDAPYLSPTRGERNEPAKIKDIFEFIVSNF